MPSGVKTPELNVSAYQPMEPPPPLPQMPTNNQLPTSAGYTSKAGAGAFIFSNIIDGYLKGRQHAQQVQQQKADQEIRGTEYTYQTMAQNYRDLLKNGKAENDPEVLKAKQAATAAWQASLDVKAKYTLPQDDQKKKGAKEKTEGIFKGIFGKEGIQPHFIPAAALAALKSSPPPGLSLSPEDKAAMTEQKESEFRLSQEQVEAKRKDEQWGWIKDDQKRNQQWNELNAKDPATLTLGEKQTLNQLTRLKAVEKDPIRGARDFDLSQKIQSGAKMTAGEMQIATADGLLAGPHIEQRTDASGRDELLTIDPTSGKVLSRTTLGRHYAGEGAAAAISLAKFQRKQQYDDLKKAFPNADDATIYRAMAEENSKHPEQLANFIGDNPQQKAKDVEAVNAALKSVWSEYYDPITTHAKDPGALREHEIIQNFITTPDKNDASGTFAFKKALEPTGKQMTHWHLFGPNEYAPTYQGNATPQELQATARALYNRTRQALQKKGQGKYTDADLDRMLPPSYADISGYGGLPNGPLEQPPGTQQAKQGATGYQVTTADGVSHFYSSQEFPESSLAEVQRLHPDVKIQAVYGGGVP
jgi:hypothetical protein